MRRPPRLQLPPRKKPEVEIEFRPPLYPVQPLWPGNAFQGDPYWAEPESTVLTEYWQILRRRKAVLAVFAIVGLLAGMGIAALQTPVYRARASLEILELNDDFLNIKRALPFSESGSTTAPIDIETQIRILQSDTLIERVLAALKIERPEDLKPPTGNGSVFRALYQPGRDLPPAPKEDAIEAVRKNLSVRAESKTRLVEVLYESQDPKVAALLINALTAEFVDESIRSRWDLGQRTGEWLSGRLYELRSKLERAENALQHYARKSGLVITSGTENVSENKLRRLQEALVQAQTDRLARQSRYEMAMISRPDSLPDVLNDRSLRELQTKLTELNREYADLRSTFNAEYPKVKRIEAQIASMTQAIEKERTSIIHRIKNEYDEALRHERLLTGDFNSQLRNVSSDAEKAIQYHLLKREVDSTRQLYDLLLQRMKEMNITSALRASNVRVVDPAKTPRRPARPNMALQAGLSLLTGLLLGVAFVILRERSDHSVQQPGDLDLYLDSSELGVIPSARLDEVILLEAGDGDGRHVSLDLKEAIEGVVVADAAKESSGIAPAGRRVARELVETGRALGGILSAAPVHKDECARWGWRLSKAWRLRLSVLGQQAAQLGMGALVLLGRLCSALLTRVRTYLAGARSRWAEAGSRRRRHAADDMNRRQNLVAWKYPHSLMAESFRAVLTSLLLSDRNGEAPRVVVVTSAGPAEGKTTVASNLAIAAAEIHQDVLLIDADLRSPSLHEIFALRNDHGLANLLLRAVGPGMRNSWRSALRRTEFEGLRVIPSGCISASCISLLYSHAILEMIEAAKEEFNLIILDTPPMLDISDARMLGRLADGVILVARANQTTREALQVAQQRLAKDGVKVLGTVLNDWDLESTPGPYYGGYGSRYRNYASYRRAGAGA